MTRLPTLRSNWKFCVPKLSSRCRRVVPWPTRFPREFYTKASALSLLVRAVCSDGCSRRLLWRAAETAVLSVAAHYRSCVSVCSQSEGIKVIKKIPANLWNSENITLERFSFKVSFRPSPKTAINFKKTSMIEKSTTQGLKPRLGPPAVHNLLQFQSFAQTLQPGSHACKMFVLPSLSCPQHTFFPRDDLDV